MGSGPVESPRDDFRKHKHTKHIACLDAQSPINPQRWLSRDHKGKTKKERKGPETIWRTIDATQHDNNGDEKVKKRKSKQTNRTDCSKPYPRPPWYVTIMVIKTYVDNGGNVLSRHGDGWRPW